MAVDALRHVADVVGRVVDEAVVAQFASRLAALAVQIGVALAALQVGDCVRPARLLALLVLRRRVFGQLLRRFACSTVQRHIELLESNREGNLHVT